MTRNKLAELIDLMAKAIDPVAYKDWELPPADHKGRRLQHKRRKTSIKNAKASLRAIEDAGFDITPTKPDAEMVDAACKFAAKVREDVIAPSTYMRCRYEMHAAYKGKRK